MRLLYVTLAVVGIVVLAGCAGIGGDDVDAMDETVYPDGYDETGIVDAQAAIDAHRAGLDAADGIDASLEIEEDGEHQRLLEQRQLIDNENGVVLSRTTAGDETRTSYQTAEGTVYTKQQRDGSTAYRQDEAGFGTAGIDIDDAVGLLEGIEMDRSEEERDDRTLFGYETGQSQDTEFGDEIVTLEAATIVVDDEGRIHSLSITATREDAETTIDARFEYGSVTVEEPDWLDEAIEATGGDDL